MCSDENKNQQKIGKLTSELSKFMQSKLLFITGSGNNKAAVH